MMKQRVNHSSVSGDEPSDVEENNGNADDGYDNGTMIIHKHVMVNLSTN